VVRPGLDTAFGLCTVLATLMTLPIRSRSCGDTSTVGARRSLLNASPLS